MRTKTIVLIVAAAGLSALLAKSAPAAVRYVNLNNPAPAPPYTTWATAATNIQDAIDAAQVGDTVLVTNGMYATGGRAVDGLMTNRVAVTQPVRVESVNGPAVTVIAGRQVPGTFQGLGDGAVRCVYLMDGAVLAGFTLTNGATRMGDEPEIHGGGVWCTSTNPVVTNCVLTGNAAYAEGGGSYQGTLNNCTLTGNSAYYGGGAAGGTLNNCTVISNSAGSRGGGADYSTLNYCTLTGNTAYGGCGIDGCDGYGGGAFGCTLNNCRISGNAAGQSGGGAEGGTLNNCTLSGNSGGGAYGGTLNNCTLTGNNGYGATGGVLNNCIVYYNYDETGQTAANYWGSDLNFCCTTPLPADGVGNISAEPQLASVSHLNTSSPCRGAGSAAHATGVDIDGEAWANPPSIGCDEFQPGAVTGPLSVAILANFTNVATGFELNFTAQINGRTSLSRWEFGDGTGVTNRPYTAHGWVGPGDYSVVLWAYSESFPGGVSATVIVHVAESPVHYVAADSANPVAPYRSWATATTNIQDAVDAAYVGGMVLVSNGVYRTGGRAVYGLTNRASVDKPITVRSVNGPAATVIQGCQGNWPVRCAYLTHGAALVGFTLTNGGTLDYYFQRSASGGGVWCASTGAAVSNCTLTGNSAILGGGAAGGTLNNCVFNGNFAVGRFGWGGGAFGATLNNCTLTRNSARYGGGAEGGTLNNCILFNNTHQGLCEDGCDPGSGSLNGNNWYGDPLFVDWAGGNLRLHSNSPCINSGFNGYAPPGFDLDGHPRIVGGAVDVGAYEFQSPQSVISYAWLQNYGLPTDGSADFTDTDGDGLNNWQEWRCLTDPTNALSVLRLLAPASGAPGVTVRWQSVTNRTYFLERSTNLGAQPVFGTLASNLIGQAGTTVYTDTNAVGTGPFFYRVGLQE